MRFRRRVLKKDRLKEVVADQALELCRLKKYDRGWGEVGGGIVLPKSLVEIMRIVEPAASQTSKNAI